MVDPNTKQVEETDEQDETVGTATTSADEDGDGND